MQDQHRGTGAQAQAADRQEPAILVERPQDGIAVVTLNRPGARNALSLEVLKGLREIF